MRNTISDEWWRIVYWAWLELKALAWAWLWWAWAFKILSQARIEGLFTIYGYNCQRLQNSVKKRQTMAKYHDAVQNATDWINDGRSAA